MREAAAIGPPCSCISCMSRPSRLRLEHARFSPFASRVSVTLVTAYDVTRLHMLDGLCGSWGGHLSAAIYQAGLRPAFLTHISHGGNISRVPEKSVPESRQVFPKFATRRARPSCGMPTSFVHH